MSNRICSFLVTRTCRKTPRKNFLPSVIARSIYDFNILKSVPPENANIQLDKDAAGLFISSSREYFSFVGDFSFGGERRWTCCSADFRNGAKYGAFQSCRRGTVDSRGKIVEVGDNKSWILKEGTPSDFPPVLVLLIRLYSKGKRIRNLGRIEGTDKLKPVCIGRQLHNLNANQFLVNRREEVPFV